MTTGPRAGALDPFGPRLGHQWAAHAGAAHVREIDGTLGFFDVSGYTKLTERLARLGAAGAEGITEIANALFVGLISAAFAEGGDVLQFSGDAILVHFTDDDHAPRACRAATAMQQFIAESGAIDTELGRVRLRMSAGLHSGPGTFALLGDRQLAVLALGEHASATLAAEKEANAGEVLVSPSTAALVDAGWSRPSRAGFRRLTRVPAAAPEPLDRDWLRPPVPDPIARAFVPVPLRSLLMETGQPGEHRQISLAFVGVRELDRVLATRGPDRAATALQELAEVLEQVQEQYDLAWVGTDALPDAAAFVLTAGVPVAHEDDEDRILLACRDLVDGGIDLDLAIGVNRGRNFTGDVGHPWRRTYGFSGDATNLAARIMAHASPGELLVHEPMMRRVRGTATVRTKAPFTAKGKAAPVAIVHLDQLRPRDAGGDAHIPLVGREPELVAMRTRLDAAQAGEGGVIDVVGAAGMGKSRLLHALRDGAEPELDWIVITGEPYAKRRALFPMRRLLRRILDVDDTADPARVTEALTGVIEARARQLVPWIPLIAGVAGGVVGATAETERLHSDFVAETRDAVTSEAILALTGVRSVLVFEDVHWFDDASLTMISQLARGATEAGTLVIVTRRPGDAEFVADVDELLSIELDPLDDNAGIAVLLAAAGAPIAEHHLAALVRRGGGNPLFLAELGAAGATADVVPETIERVLATRIDGLDHRDRRRLRDAAVAGDPVDLTLLACALERPELAAPDAWRGAIGLAEVVDGTLRFANDLVREAAYDGLSHARRRVVHAHLARAITDTAQDTREVAPLLALHWSEAREWDDAWTWARVAVDDAVARHAPVEAHALAQRALDAGRRLPSLETTELAAIVETSGDLANRIGLLESAHADYAHARRLVAEDPVSVARLARKRGDVTEKQGRYPQSLRWYRRGLLAAEAIADTDVRRELATELRLSYAGTLHHQDRNALSRATTLDLLADAERVGGEVLSQTYLQLATTTAMIDRSDGEPYATRAEEIIRAHDDDLRLACLHLNLGVAAVEANRFSAALDRYPHAERAFARCGDAVGAALAIHNRGELLALLGRDGATDCFTDALRRFRANGYEAGVLMATSGLGRAATFAGDLARARELLQQARDGFAALGHRAFALDTDLRLAETAIAGDDLAEAERILRAAATGIGRLERPGVLRGWCDRLGASVLVREGRAADADRILEGTVAAALADGFEIEAASGLEVRARVAQRLGTDSSRFLAERDAIVDRLGVVRLLTV